MRELGMGALLGVGQGSEREAQLVVMQWWGAGRPEGTRTAQTASAATSRRSTRTARSPSSARASPSIPAASRSSPPASMEDMKWDMAGAAVVIGLMKALAGRRAKVNAVGIVGLVENMPSGTAQRPGDVVKSMSGQTIEVINTDAEGRLVLADALWYCKQRFQPRLMIDLATLTGAIIVALGHEKAGLFANDDELAERIAGRRRHRRAAVAAAAGRGVRQADQVRHRRHEERRQPRRRLDHRRAVPAALRRRDALGASRHRRRRLGEEGRQRHAEGRQRLRRAPARSADRRQLRADSRRSAPDGESA